MYNEGKSVTNIVAQIWQKLLWKSNNYHVTNNIFVFTSYILATLLDCYYPIIDDNVKLDISLPFMLLLLWLPSN
jgi:hypothetical protein